MPRQKTSRRKPLKSALIFRSGLSLMVVLRLRLWNPGLCRSHGIGRSEVRIIDERSSRGVKKARFHRRWQAILGLQLGTGVFTFRYVLSGGRGVLVGII